MKKRITASLLLISILYSMIFIPTIQPDGVSAYGETTIKTEQSTADTTIHTPGYQTWLPEWQSESPASTGNIILTPGSDESCMNFSWYSESIGRPAVQISADPAFAKNKIFDGTAAVISRSNGTTTYRAANHVSIKNYLQPGKTYYYRYTCMLNSTAIVWSGIYTFCTPDNSSVTAILTGDPQIGASGNIASDAYNWSQTLRQALQTAPGASFLLSAGDQINYKTDDDPDCIRESEYAGFLYPSQLRRLPVAAAIGNHETKGSDYQYHFNTPNSENNYGSTPSGCDYYFSRGSILFIVLNSNSRKMSAHRKLMKKATASHPDAGWRIVLMHHDIYGSGAMHSNRTSANLRTIFAPLMDEYSIDLVFSGHDHSYARSDPMLDGTAIDYPGNTLTDPLGTTYIALGTSSGSKMYGLTNPKQYYVAERSNNPLPTFSVLTVAGNTLSLKTFDQDGKPYADDFTIRKTKKKSNPLATVKKAKNLKKQSYTKSSYNKLKSALKNFEDLFHITKTDKGAEKIENYFRTAKDPLSYYGYAKGTTDPLPAKFSTLLDKTRLHPVSITPSAFTKAYKEVTKTRKKLVKTTLRIKKGKKTLKNGTKLTIKKGKKLRLKITAAPARYKVSCTSRSKKYVSISKKGVIRAKKKGTGSVAIRFQNRTITLKIRVR